MYGELTVITGPMFSSKTTELLKRILWAKNGENKEVLVIKPAFDDRYSITKIVSHDGLSVDAESITSWANIYESALFADMIFIDELQFFCEPYFSGDIIQEVINLLKQGKTVIANGLDMDFEGNAFPITKTLFTMADNAIKLRSNCVICGKNATKTYKKKLSYEQQVELGSSDLYEARCNKHWYGIVEF
jgi:thymidine kinase